MAVRHFLENHWPSITIAVTATAIAGAFLVMLRSMPPHQIVMATGREGDAYYEIGERYRAALSNENVQVQLVPTAGSVENLAMLRDPHSGVNVALIEGGILSAAETSGVESLGTVFYEPLWWFHKREILGEAANTEIAARLDRLEEQANHLRIPVAYASMLYELRNHIDLVSEGLKKHAETMKEEVLAQSE